MARTIGHFISMIVFALIFGYAVQLLWNWLMPGLFSLKQIGYWEGFGIVVLTRILFGSILPHPFIRNEEFRAMRHFRRYAWDEDFMQGRDKMYKWKFYGQYWKEEGREAFKKYIEKHEQDMKKNETFGSDNHGKDTGTPGPRE
jgi:hypothetical protein